MKSLYPILFILAIFPNVLWSNIIYVNPLSSGTSDGTDWQHAFHDLQEALAIAVDGDTIWVAEGAYYPTSGNDRDISFNVPNGVVLLGGFSGAENSIEDRTWENYPTILSGNIGDMNDSTDNSFHVLFLADTDSTTIIDGFIIRDGYAKPPMPGTSSNDNNGGGALITATLPDLDYSPVLNNCTFEYNVARNGGAIYCDANAGVKLFASEFKYNRATLNGGAVYKVGGNEFFYSYYIINCIFEKNKALDSGGAIYHDNPIGASFIDSSIFERDSCMSEGGAIYWFATSNAALLELKHSIFEFNKSGNGGALSFLYGGYSPDDFFEFRITSCVFNSNTAKNGLGGGASIINTQNCKLKLQLNDCLFESNSGNNGGGGLYFNNAINGESEIIIDECRFYRNYCPLINASGAFYYQGSTYNTIAVIKVWNSIFYGNRGCVGFISPPTGKLNSEIKNCSFANNGDYVIVKNWETAFDTINYYNILHIYNSIFWEHTPLFKLFFNNNPQDPTIHDYHIDHSIINSPDCVVEGVDFCGDGILFETWPMFADTVAGDLRIALCSPAVNAGNNTAIDTTEIVTDIAGGIRKVGGTVDIGAYEQQYESIQALASVQNASNAGANDGSILLNDFIGGNAPFTILWENGDITSVQTELSIGDYIITITDADGCAFADTVTVDFTNGLSDPVKRSFRLYPNPAKEALYLSGSLPEGASCDFYLYDAWGRLILTDHPSFDREYSTRRIWLGEEISPGLYFYNIMVNGVVIKSGKVLKD